jgi:hypothetical protein
MANLVEREAKRQNAKTQTAPWSVRVFVSRDVREGVLWLGYPEDDTATPRAVMRIGIAIDIRERRSIGCNVTSPRAIVKESRICVLHISRRAP